MIILILQSNDTKAHFPSLDSHELKNPILKVLSFLPYLTFLKPITTSPPLHAAEIAIEQLPTTGILASSFLSIAKAKTHNMTNPSAKANNAEDVEMP